MSRWPFLRLHREHFLMLTLSRSSAVLNVYSGGVILPPLNSSNILDHESLWFVLGNANGVWGRRLRCLCQMTFAENTAEFVLMLCLVSLTVKKRPDTDSLVLTLNSLWLLRRNSLCIHVSVEGLFAAQTQRDPALAQRQPDPWWATPCKWPWSDQKHFNKTTSFHKFKEK